MRISGNSGRAGSFAEECGPALLSRVPGCGMKGIGSVWPGQEAVPMLLRVEKIRKKAHLLLSDGSRLKGEFFLSPHSPLRAGRERVADLLMGDKYFLPFQVEEGGVIFIQRDCIALAELEEREVERGLPYVLELAAQISLLMGETLQGLVFLDLPKEHSRLSDFFNSCRGFFYLTVGEKEYVLNSRFVKTVIPCSED